MTTIKDITDYLRAWYRELWCGSNRFYVCSTCKFTDICEIYCCALNDIRKSGDYH